MNPSQAGHERSKTRSLSGWTIKRKEPEGLAKANHRKFRDLMNGVIRLTHHDQKVSGLIAGLLGRAIGVYTPTGIIKWNPNWLNVIRAKHGKPHGFSAKPLAE